MEGRKEIGTYFDLTCKYKPAVLNLSTGALKITTYL